jgi:hypothetical protein
MFRLRHNHHQKVEAEPASKNHILSKIRRRTKSKKEDKQANKNQQTKANKNKDEYRPGRI